MKIELNNNACFGCGACIATAPENFDYDDNGYAKVISDNITDKTIEAANNCPVEAITIKNECHCNNCNCNNDCKCD